MQRFAFNLCLSFATCAGFHMGQTANVIQGMLYQFQSKTFVASTVICMALNLVGLLQPQPHRECNEHEA